jgi:hypothetical protein
MKNALLAGLVAGPLFAAAGSAHAQGAWPGYFGPMHAVGPWMVFGFVWMLLFWTLAVIGAYTVVRWVLSANTTQPSNPRSPPPTPDVPQEPADKVVRSDTWCSTIGRAGANYVSVRIATRAGSGVVRRE